MLLDRVSERHIKKIEISLEDDTVTVRLNEVISEKDEQYAWVTEVIQITSSTPEYLVRALEQLTRSVVKAVRERNKPGGYKSDLQKCSTCTVACCVDHDVIPLDKEDVERLSDGCGLIAEMGIDMAPHLLYTGAVAMMKRRPLDDGSGRLGCYFLQNRRCSIHEYRPRVCREHSEYYCTDYVQISKKK
jgi:Fe-S-cluster containining protein